MKILLTNDDGIYADGIYALYESLKKIGTVTVVAPDAQQSSVGHGITLAHPIWPGKIKRKGKFFGYGISGTPADCVKFAIGVILKRKPDLVVSGINLGSNDGCSVHYSGTVAGAREGSLMGIPSIAVSLDAYFNPIFSSAAQYTVSIIKQLKHHKIPKGSFLNINVPNVATKNIRGIKVTRQCMVPIHGSFKRRIDPSLRDYYWMSGRLPTKRKNVAFDTYALGQKYVTVTPVHCDLTNYSLLNEMHDWNLA